MKDENQFNEEVNNLSKYFDAKVITNRDYIDNSKLDKREKFFWEIDDKIKIK